MRDEGRYIPYVMCHHHHRGAARRHPFESRAKVRFRARVEPVEGLITDQQFWLVHDCSQ